MANETGEMQEEDGLGLFIHVESFEDWKRFGVASRLGMGL